MKHLVLVGALIGVAGCRIAPVTLGGDSTRGQALSNRTEFAEKIVNMKRSPATLVAKDGSRCRVDEQTWHGVRVGDSYACMWEYGSR
jgi:hypothetical protein